MAKVKDVIKSKVPIKVHICDDFVVEDGSEKYYPHAGERVWFYPRPTFGNTLKLMRFQNIISKQQAESDLEGVSDKTQEDMQEALADLVVLLEESIKEWEWTDNDNNPYAKAPTAAILTTIGIDEIIYLVGIVVGAKKEGDSDQKN